MSPNIASLKLLSLNAQNRLKECKELWQEITDPKPILESEATSYGENPTYRSFIKKTDVPFKSAMIRGLIAVVVGFLLDHTVKRYGRRFPRLTNTFVAGRKFFRTITAFA